MIANAHAEACTGCLVPLLVTAIDRGIILVVRDTTGRAKPLAQLSQWNDGTFGFQAMMDRELQLSPFPSRDASFVGARIQHRLAIGFLQILHLPLVLLTNVLGLCPQDVLHASLDILNPAFDLGRDQVELGAGRSNRRLALDDLKNQRRPTPRGPTLDLFVHHFAHRYPLREN